MSLLSDSVLVITRAALRKNDYLGGPANWHCCDLYIEKMSDWNACFSRNNNNAHECYRSSDECGYGNKRSHS